MDLKSLIAQATKQIVAEERVSAQSTNHADTNSVHPVNEVASQPEMEQIEDQIEEILGVGFNEDSDSDEYTETDEQGTDSSISIQLPSASVAGNCSHMCSNSNCQEWWSHGPASKCRYPDLANQGLCPKCLTTDNSTQLPEADIVPCVAVLGPDDFRDINGKPQLSPRAQVHFRNEELKRVKNMSVEQLTHHIQHYAQMIEELRVRALQSRAKRAELEEEALQDIPEEEREKFIQTLRNGNKPKKAKVEKVKKESPKSKEKDLISTISAQPGKTLKEAQVIASWMLKTGKTQAEVEAWLND